MISNFKEFIDNIITESLHPELQQIISKKGNSGKNKQTEIANKIKVLTAKGESTGIEGNMPKGSSRAYLKHKEKHEAIVDGKPAKLETGTKVAIKAALDKFRPHGEMSLGAMQNRAEAGDYWVNSHYRTLTHDSVNPNHFHTNPEGIFPPLIDHDHEDDKRFHKGHEWSHVGHARDIKAGEFQKLTKTPEHPKGISHEDFYKTLNRFHDRNNGKHWTSSEENEKHMNKVEEHPLVQKFMDYHGNTGHPTQDYIQQKNMGIWKHPHTGEEHIVARDHGFDTEVADAYSKARKNSATWKDNR